MSALLQTLLLVCQTSFFGRDCGSHGPTCSYKGQSVNTGENGKLRHQTHLMRHRANGERQPELQESPEKIKSVLHASHEMVWNHFHQPGINGDPSDARGSP